MKCEFDYCLYNRESSCILEKIGIDGLGMCDACIVVMMDTVFLESEKEKQLEEIQRHSG